MGLAFPNRLGVAAGLDKDAEHIDGLATLGVGFIECGTVTPRPQRGNPKPRLFRLAEGEALINRLGFNNQGIDHFIGNVERAKFGPKHGRILGLNIGRKFDTPNARAIDDYRACFAAVYTHASYVTVNISSPNTPGLRALHENSALEGLLSGLKVEQARLAQKHGKYTPLVVKLSPDLAAGDLARVARSLIAHRNQYDCRSKRGQGNARRRRSRRALGTPAHGEVDRGHPRIGKTARWRTADHRNRRHYVGRGRQSENRRRRNAGADLHRTRVPG